MFKLRQMKGGNKMKKITLGVLVFSIIALLGIGIVIASPFGFGKKIMAQELTEEEQTEMQAFHDSLKEAIKNEDFESWKSLMESQLTEENFNKMVEMHQNMKHNCEENDCPNFKGCQGMKMGFKSLF